MAASGKAAARVGRPEGELRARVISSLVLAPLALAAAYLGGAVFVIFWTLAALGVLWEWVGLVAAGDRQATIVAGAGCIIGAMSLLLADADGLAALVMILGAALVALLAPQGQRGWQAAGLIYAGTIATAPALLRGQDAVGLIAILLVFAVVWATDIFAYFTGRALGGPRLWPAVSPKKTWSGALGGALAAIGAGAATSAVAGLRVTGAFLLACCVLSIASQAGDLFESAMKRRFGAKDSSHLIPGHGGLMDRLDGFVVAVLFATAIGVARAGADAPAHGLLVW